MKRHRLLAFLLVVVFVTSATAKDLVETTAGPYEIWIPATWAKTAIVEHIPRHALYSAVAWKAHQSNPTLILKGDYSCRPQHWAIRLPSLHLGSEAYDAAEAGSGPTAPQILIHKAIEWAGIDEDGQVDPARAVKYLQTLRDEMEHPGEKDPWYGNPVFVDAELQFVSARKRIDFRGGHGYRMLAQWNDESRFAQRGRLHYLFLGLSDDGSSQIIATIPIDLPGLPTEKDTVHLGWDIKAYEIFSQEFGTYEKAVQKWLSKNSQRTTPSLDKLDAMMASIHTPPSGVVDDRTCNIQRLLAGCVVPRADFRDVPLREAIDYLKKRMHDLDPGRRGLGLALSLYPGNRDDSVNADTLPETRFNLSLTNAPLAEVFDKLTSQVGLRYIVVDCGVLLVPLDCDEKAINTREWPVTPEILLRFGYQTGDELAAAMEAQGIGFPEGAWARLSEDGQRLTVKNTEANLRFINVIAGPSYTVPVALPRKELRIARKKLTNIILPKVEFKNAPVRNALKALEKLGAQFDPERKGIAISVVPEVDADATPPASADSTQKGWIHALPPSKSPRVTISLENVSLGEALSTIANSASLAWEFDGRGVRVMPLIMMGDGDPTREWKITPEMLYATGYRTGSDIKAFLIGKGIPFPQGTVASLVRNQTLLAARNTRENLELVEGLLYPDNDGTADGR